MTALSTVTRKEVEIAIKGALGLTLTGTQKDLALKTNVLKMWWSESGGDGSAAKMDTLATWAKTKPLALNFLNQNDDFIKVIDGTTSFTTAANGLPSTYIALHAEDVTKEAPLKGLIALRVNAVDSTFGTTGANLGATGGTALADATVMGYHSTWGATKFNAIFNKGLIKAITVESDANYDTLAEVIAVYDAAWTNAVPKDTFFGAFTKFVEKGVNLKFSELWADVNNLANFQSHTSDNAIKLMASTGGSWATITGLAAQKYADLTTANAATAIDKCGATYTSLNTIYTASSVKANTLLSDNAVKLCSLPTNSINTATQSTAYGTTYTTAKDIDFRAMVDPKYHELYTAGMTLTTAAALGDKLQCVGNNAQLKQNLILTGSDINTVLTDLNGLPDLVTSPTVFGGFEVLDPLCY